MCQCALRCISQDFNFDGHFSLSILEFYDALNLFIHSILWRDEDGEVHGVERIKEI